MPNRSTEIGRIIRYGDTDLARRRILSALRKSRGGILGAARILRVGWLSLYRWIFRLALENELAEIRRAARTQTRRGRPPGWTEWDWHRWKRGLPVTKPGFVPSPKSMLDSGRSDR